MIFYKKSSYEVQVSIKCIFELNKRIWRKISKLTLDEKEKRDGKKNERLFNYITISFLLIIFYNVGAKGALQDSSITLEEALTYEIQDEYLAQARYNIIIAKFGSIRSFTQIKLAEQRHISALLSLFERYNIKVLKTMQNSIQKNLVL
jgi:hypothetical protein